MEKVPVAQFHVVVRGHCWLKIQDHMRMLSAGDVVMFPLGEPHALMSAPQVSTISGQDVLAAYQAGEPCFSTGEESVKLLCGHCQLDRDVQHPLIQDLPSFVHIKDMGQRHLGWLEMVSKVLIGEMDNRQPGSSSVIDRLAEVLFIQVLRAYVIEQREPHGFLAAMRSPQLHQALEVIHAEMHQPLTVAEIARAAGMSRSSLAARFKEQLGISPMNYLTRWRMLKARDLLQTYDLSIMEVAEQVGYQSESAFHRIFKREFQQSPSTVRRMKS